MSFEEMLKNYRYNLGQKEMCEIKERKLLQQLKELEEDDVFIKAVEISDMPRSTTNKISRTVENMLLEREERSKNRAMIMDQIAEVGSEKFEYQIEIDRVDALIKLVGMEERFILKMHYIEGLCWTLVAEQYKKEFGQYRSIDAIKRKRDSAMKIIKEAA